MCRRLLGMQRSNSTAATGRPEKTTATATKNSLAVRCANVRNASKAKWSLSRSSRGGLPHLRQSWIPHDPQYRLSELAARPVSAHSAPQEKCARFAASPAQVRWTWPVIPPSADTATFQTVSAHTFQHPYAPWALSLPEGKRPFKTHRPTCRGAVQSNPSLAHRRGVQVYLSLQKSVAVALT